MVKIFLLSGGYCSRLYICEDTSVATDNSSGHVKKLLIRLFGGKLIQRNSGSRSLDDQSELLLFHDISRHGLGPKLYGAFDKGRLEEYIPSHTLNKSDLDDPEIRSQFARKLARIHQLDVPIKRVVRHIVTMFEERFKAGDNDLARQKLLEVCKSNGMDPEWALKYDWKQEISWLKKTAASVATRNVVALYDMNRLNCLVREQVDSFGEKVTLIDYELGMFTTRGHDLANHFIWWTVDVSNVDDEFRSELDYPSDDVRRQYVVDYLGETSKSSLKLDIDGIDSIDHVLMEVDIHGLIACQMMITAAFVIPLTSVESIVAKNFMVSNY